MDLPLVFTCLLGLSIFAYVVLDGYDLGVGILSGIERDQAHVDRMIASIGPYWDANETWLVLGVGLLLVAFPVAHGIILQELYLPVAFMLIALIMRGVAFEFRIKVVAEQKHLWNRVFFAGSLLTALTQGYMLGQFVIGFEATVSGFLFSLLTAVCLVFGYVLLGATWLILKTDEALQTQSILWSKIGLIGTAIGILAISLVTPLVNERVFSIWFAFPEMLFKAPLPIATVIIGVLLWRMLEAFKDDRHSYAPFLLTLVIFALCFTGIAISMFPYIVPDQMTIWEAASSDAALGIILVGTMIVLPIIIGYTIIAHKIFWGKAPRAYQSSSLTALM